MSSPVADADRELSPTRNGDRDRRDRKDRSDRADDRERRERNDRGDERRERREKRDRRDDRDHRSPSPPSKKSRRSDDREERDRDRDRMRDRGRDDRDSRKRDRSRDRSPDAKKRKEKESRKDARKEQKNGADEGRPAEDVEEGEVVREPEIKREPTARDLERLRLIQEEIEKGGGDDDEEPVWSVKKSQLEKPTRQCPYLDTIDRGVLDFDFEKLCSVSLSHLNVYACMVCGKYFQGRGTQTHAYTHSLDSDHRVFLNLQTLRFYCLPDNYEIIDPSLDDIKYVLKPMYTKEHIATLDQPNRRMARAFDDTPYHPGVVGLNNIKANDYANVVLHALSNVPPLRDYFLREENYANIKRPPGDKLEILPRRFGELIRKLWNPKAFKAHVSPHEMLQAAVICSEKKFQIIKQGDAAEFLNFLLNTLHIALGGTKKDDSSIVYKIFRGQMREFTRKVLPVDTPDEDRRRLLETPEFQEKMKVNSFLYLSLDLPAAPLYQDELLQNIIPQVPLSALLKKFDGTTEKEYKTYNENFMKRFELLRLPPYLIVTYRRFQKNQFFIEKNPTIVNFPISNVDLYECIAEECRDSVPYTTYDLVSNIVHDGRPESGSYRIQTLHNKWFELEDLHVKEILPQMITLAESYIQIWRLNTQKTRMERMDEEREDVITDMK